MRIGIEAQRLLRPHKHGMDIVALELIRSLQAIDQENSYFIFVRPDQDEACLHLRDNFTLVRVTGPTYIYWEQVALPLAIRRYNLDVLHCTANTGPLLVNVPLILTLHDTLFLTPPAVGSTATAYQRFGNRYRALLVRRLIARCQTILTVSSFSRQQIRADLEQPQLAIDVLHNGVSPRFSIPISLAQRCRAQTRYQLPDRYFLFLGSADPRKNMQNVLRAFLLYGTIDETTRLVCSGQWPAGLSTWFTAEECLQLSRRCQFVGYIRAEDLPAVYMAASVFLFPSLSEGFGLPILEAMACGTPVITSTVTAMPEVAGQAALLVNPRLPAELAGAMERLVQDTTLRQTLIQRGKQQINRFSWTASAHQLQAIYQRYATDVKAITPTDYRLADSVIP